MIFKKRKYDKDKPYIYYEDGAPKIDKEIYEKLQKKLKDEKGIS